MGRRSVAGMLKLVRSIVSVLARRFRNRGVLELENLALRHQLHVLRRQRPGRPRLFSTDRLLWVWLYRIWPRCLDAMVLVKPATVIQWHRKGFRLYWRRRTRPLGRPKKSTQIRDLIRRMSMANPLWGAPRIHGELLKLGIAVCQAAVGRYMPWRPKLPSPTWRSFLHNHSIEEVVTAPRSPWQNAYVERIIGSIRRECLDHIIIFDERHLRRMLSAYFQYHQHSRTHLSLCK